MIHMISSIGLKHVALFFDNEKIIVHKILLYWMPLKTSINISFMPEYQTHILDEWATDISSFISVKIFIVMC